MDRDTIIRLAREAGLLDNGVLRGATDDSVRVERFAALVAAAERQAVLDATDALMGMERERNPMFSEGYDYALEHIEQVVRGRQSK